MNETQSDNKTIKNSAEKPYRSRYGTVLRAISSVLVVTFLAQDFVHAQGGQPLWSHVQDAQVSTHAPDTEDKLSNIAIPYDAGLARKAVVKSGSDLIINIQDAHSKMGAQESITKILDNLVKNYNLKLIALEGAAEAIDTSLVSSFPIEEVRKKTGEYLLKEGKISAATFYSMITKDPVSLYGVEDPELYKQNLDVFKKLIDQKKAIRAELQSLQRAVRDLETKVYSPSFWTLPAANSSIRTATSNSPNIGRISAGPPKKRACLWTATPTLRSSPTRWSSKRKSISKKRVSSATL